MNIPAVLLLLFSIAITLFISERMAKARLLSMVLARKVVHIVAVTAVAISPAFFSNLLLFGLIVAGFTGLLFWAVATNKLTIDEVRRRKSWGIALFPVSFILLLLFFGKSKPWLVIYPMLVLAMADAAAAMVGELFASRFFYLSGDRKSWQGSLAFVFTTVLLLWWLPTLLAQVHPIFAWSFSNQSGWYLLGLLFFVAIIAATAEALGSGGFDNLLVPFFVAWGMELITAPNALQACALAISLAIPVTFLAYMKKWLDAGGAVSAALLGVMVWVEGAWVAAAPMLLFFVSGSLLGRLPRRANSDAKHNKPRDWVQVAANGGIAGLLLMAYTFYPHKSLQFAFFVSVAICTSDTWSSEIGQWAGGKVRDIVGWKSLETGLSGGVSWQGTLGGLLGALVIGLTGKWLGGHNWLVVVLITFTGFTGMLADSVIGSVFQSRYLLKDGRLTEDKKLAFGMKPQKGCSWMTNDLVNLVSNFLVTGAVLLAMSLS